MNDEKLIKAVRIINVLDKGFVRLEDKMGGDSSVVRAARVSYKSEPKTADEDRKLIGYLLKHHHGTPFEHAVFQFHIKLPIFVARQWIRHRMSSYNETSFRYREAPEEFYQPKKWRAQDTKNKQGSIGSVEDDAQYGEALGYIQGESMRVYKKMLGDGVSREMARMVLPVNLYTEWYWTVNARALMHFITLRSENHAQWEMRQYSHALARLMSWEMQSTWQEYSATLGAGYEEMRAEMAKHSVRP